MEKRSLHEDIFQTYSTHDIADLLTRHGLMIDIDIVSKKGKLMTCYCAIGAK
jgi:hypothetical protein